MQCARILTLNINEQEFTVIVKRKEQSIRCWTGCRKVGFQFVGEWHFCEKGDTCSDSGNFISMTHPGKPQIASCATDGRPGGQLGESGDQPGGGRAFRRRKKTTLGEYYPLIRIWLSSHQLFGLKEYSIAKISSPILNVKVLFLEHCDRKSKSKLSWLMCRSWHNKVPQLTLFFRMLKVLMLFLPLPGNDY